MTDRYEQLQKNIKTISEPYDGLMRLTMDAARAAIQDLQDNIESQKEEIERLKRENAALVRIGNQAYAEGLNASSKK